MADRYFCMNCNRPVDKAHECPCPILHPTAEELLDDCEESVCTTKSNIEGLANKIASERGYVTKDSGKRQEYASGMVRDLQDGKPDFSLLLPEMPYDLLPLTRWAALMTRGAEKYGRRNWQVADSHEELERFKASAFRHFVQWMAGEEDEDHMAAVMFNLNAAEYVKYKLRKHEDGNGDTSE